jgi:hypothetical protein
MLDILNITAVGSVPIHKWFVISDMWNFIFYAGQLNSQAAGNMLSATKRYIACEEIWTETMPINTSPGKDETECQSNFKNLWTLYLRDLCYTNNQFCNNFLKVATP